MFEKFVGGRLCIQSRSVSLEIFKCMLKTLRVLRPNGAACFAAPVFGPAGGRQQGIVATVCENAEPRYQDPTQEKELPARNQIGQ